MISCKMDLEIIFEKNFNLPKTGRISVLGKNFLNSSTKILLTRKILSAPGDP